MSQTGDYQLTGLQRTYLEQVRARQASVDEQVMYLIAKWIWDEAVEGEE